MIWLKIIFIVRQKVTKQNSREQTDVSEASYSAE
jgi:hypothetical protein